MRIESWRIASRSKNPNSIFDYQDIEGTAAENLAKVRETLGDTFVFVLGDRPLMDLGSPDVVAFFANEAHAWLWIAICSSIFCGRSTSRPEGDGHH